MRVPVPVGLDFPNGQARPTIRDAIAIQPKNDVDIAGSFRGPRLDPSQI
jgi:hypothetical protein